MPVKVIRCTKFRTTRWRALA